MNKLTLIGNLTRDPELRTANTASGPVSVCSFGVAVSDRRRKDANGQPETTFFNCTAWRQAGEIIARYMTKGQKICVTGPVSVRTYQANDGTTRASLEVQVDDFEFVSSRADAAAPAAAPYQSAAPAAPTAQNNGFTNVETDDLPF